MPVAYESDGGGVFCAANNNNAITVPLPATRPVGSVLLLAAFCRLITAAAPTITGYTLLGTWTSATASGGRMWLYGRIVDGTESAPSVTPVGATGTTGDIFGAGIVCYSGVDTSGGITAIFDGTPTTTDTSGTTTNTYPALTITKSDSMIVRFLSRYRDAIETFTPTATWNERADLASTNRTGGQFHMQDKLATTAGVQAAVTVAPSVTSSGRYLAVSLALKATAVLPPKQTGTDEISLANVPVPETRTGHKLGVRARTTALAGTLRLQLFEGSTARSAVLETAALSTTLANYTLSIADVDAAAITDYSNLSIKFYGYAAGGTTTVFEVDQFWLETPPGVAGPQTLYGATSMSLTFGKAVAGRRKTFGQIARPFIFTASTAGNVSTPGEFTPSDLTGLQLWYDASQLALTDGAPVTSWPDLSGQGRTLTTDMAPSFQTNELNGKPGVLFDGVDDYLTHQAGAPFVTGDQMTVIAVYKHLGGVSNGRMMAFNSVGHETDDYSTPCWCIYEGGANDRIAPYSNGELAIQVPHPATAILMNTWFDGTNHNMRVDKAPGSTPSFSMAQMEPFTDFATNRITLSMGWFGTPSSAGNNIFHEVVVYDRALTSTERDQVEAYLDEKWFGAPVGPQTYFGATSLPVAFSKDVRGQRKTFGQIARPVTFGATTSGRRKTFGQIVFPIIFTKEAVGLRKVFGQLSMQTLFGKETAGQRKTFGQIARPTIFGATIAGRRKTFGQVSLPLMFGKEVMGRLKAFGQVSLPLIFSKETQGQRKTFGQLLSPLIFGKNVAGSKQTFGQITFPITAAITTAGVRMGLRLYSSLSLPMTFSKDVRGQRKAFGQIAMPLTFAKNVVGQRKTFGRIIFPIIFTKEAVGRKNVFGQLAMQTLFGKETAGRRRTFSQLALPITFAKDFRGQRKTFGRVALPINTTIVVSGKVIHNLFGSIAMPLTFGKQVAARRQTFGQITAPLLFGSASQGKRRTFSQLVLPLDFAAAIKSGPVGVHGALRLDLILTTDVAGNIRVFGVILNEARALYLGDQEAQAAYVGDELVWSNVFSPLDLSGLATWLDAVDYAPGSWPNKGAGPPITFVGTPSPQIGPTKNGLPVVRFKTNEGRIRSVWPYPIYEYTLIYLVRWVGPGVGRAFSVQYPPSNLLVGMHTSQPDTAYDNGTWLVKGTGWNGWTPGPGPWRIYGVDSSQVEGFRFFIDGLQIQQITHGVGGLQGGWGISGYETTGPGETIDIEVPEFLLFNRKMPDAERQEVEAYLREKWGI